VTAYEDVKKSGAPVGEWARKNRLCLTQVCKWRQQKERGLLLVKRDKKSALVAPKNRKAVSKVDKSELDQTFAKAQAVLRTNEALREGIREIFSILNKIPFRP
jgi:transposase-like protein